MLQKAINYVTDQVNDFRQDNVFYALILLLIVTFLIALMMSGGRGTNAKIAKAIKKQDLTLLPSRIAQQFKKVTTARISVSDAITYDSVVTIPLSTAGCRRAPAFMKWSVLLTVALGIIALDASNILNAIWGSAVLFVVGIVPIILVVGASRSTQKRAVKTYSKLIDFLQSRVESSEPPVVDEPVAYTPPVYESSEPIIQETFIHEEEPIVAPFVEEPEVITPIVEEEEEEDINATILREVEEEKARKKAEEEAAAAEQARLEAQREEEAQRERELAAQREEEERARREEEEARQRAQEQEQRAREEALRLKEQAAREEAEARAKAEAEAKARAEEAAKAAAAKSTASGSAEDVIERINKIQREGAPLATMKEVALALQAERRKPENSSPEQQKKLNEALATLLKCMSSNR